MELLKLSEEVLIKRARIAFLKSGDTAMPAQDSSVEIIDGSTYVVLRNINGVTAVYLYDEEKDSISKIATWPEVIQ